MTTMIITTITITGITNLQRKWFAAPRETGAFAFLRVQ
jgi:hypothetical protein